MSKLNRFLKSLVLVAIVAGLSQFLFVQLFIVDGISMNPTLDDKERVIVNKLPYLHFHLKDPKYFLPFVDDISDDISNDGAFYFVLATRRGDIVVASPKMRGPRAEMPVIKRVVGMPGDTLEIQNGFVYINGKPLTEPYVKQREASNYPALRLDPDEYFLMGDNRAHSGDSRLWGPVPHQNIVGKVWFAFWPLNRLETF